MSENTTWAYIEYENIVILVKTGDWVVEKTFSLEHGTNLMTAMIIFIDELHERQFYKTLSRENTKKIHKSLEAAIRSHRDNASFHYIIDEASVEMQLMRTRLNLLENTDFYKVKEQFSSVLHDLNSSNMEAVIFSEINHEDSTDLVRKYMMLFVDLIEEFAENTKQKRIKFFTIFINRKDRSVFFEIVEARKHKYSCYSFITLDN